MVCIVEDGTETLIEVGNESGGTYVYNYDAAPGTLVDIRILAAGYQFQNINGFDLIEDNQSIPITQEADLAYVTADSDVTFSGSTHRIVVDAGVTLLNVQSGVYSAWIDWALLGSNLRFHQALRSVGGDTISVTKELGITFFLLNNWKIRPDEASYKLTIEGNIYTDPSGGSVTVPTLGTFTTQIELSVSNLTDSTIQQLSEIEFSSYQGAVYVDVGSALSGTAYPVGTVSSPVNNLVDALAIAALVGLSRLQLLSDLTITTGSDVSNLLIASNDWSEVTLQAGVTMVNTAFERLSIYGEFEGTWNICIDCWMYEVTNFSGWMRGGSIGELTLAVGIGLEFGGQSFFDNLVPLFPGVPATLTMNTLTEVSITSCFDIITIKSLVAGSSLIAGLVGGEITLDGTCTGGNVALSGVGVWTNNGTGITLNTDGMAAEEVLNLVEADEIHTATQIEKRLRGTGTPLLTKNWTGTPLNDFQAIDP